MNKKIMFAVFTISLFLLIGCEGGGTGTTAPPRIPFMGGTNGILIDFEKGNPPDEVTDDGSFGFKVLVKLKNDGEFKVEKDNIKVSLLGIDPNDFNTYLDVLTRQTPPEDLLPKRKDAEGNVLEGTTTFVTIPEDEGDELVARRFSGNTEFTFRANVCYMYQTKANIKLCILRDLVNIREDTVCNPNEAKTVYSSGAPVQITNFKETVAGKDKIAFNFDVVHSGRGTCGQGQVLKYGDGSEAGECPRDPRERRGKEDKVKVIVNTGLGNLRCSSLSDGSDNEGYVILSEGRRTVTCVQDLSPDRTDFEKPVEITLQYNYEDFKEKKVLVKHLVSDD
jgi:hypothetical protein